MEPLPAVRRRDDEPMADGAASSEGDGAAEMPPDDDPGFEER